jgi:two-component system NarL family sensor kinase
MTTVSVVMAKPELRAPRSQLQPSPPADPQRGLLRMSLDLHDGPMQDLAAVGFALERLRRDLETLPENASSLLLQVDGIREQLAVIELSLRKVIDATGSESTGSTLASLVDAELARFARLDDAQVELQAEPEIEPATDSQLIALHRVLREALTNINKHAHAGRVEVRLYEAGDVIHLEVTDDGIGFDPVLDTRPGGVGLKGMRERLKLIGSELRVESRPGGPTTIAAAVRRWRPGT